MRKSVLKGPFRLPTTYQAEEDIHIHSFVRGDGNWAVILDGRGRQVRGHLSRCTPRHISPVEYVIGGSHSKGVKGGLRQVQTTRRFDFNRPYFVQALTYRTGDSESRATWLRGGAFTGWNTARLNASHRAATLAVSHETRRDLGRIRSSAAPLGSRILVRPEIQAERRSV